MSSATLKKKKHLKCLSRHKSFDYRVMIIRHDHYRWHGYTGKKECTWVVMENNVEEVLVSPGDVVLVLLVEWMKKILPWQASGDHTVLKYQHLLANSPRAKPHLFCFFSIRHIKGGAHLHSNSYLQSAGNIKSWSTAELSSEGVSQWC